MTYVEASNAMDFEPQTDWIPKDQYEAHLRDFPILCADMVMINQGKVLLLQRSDVNSDWTGQWATVGGGVKKYESLRPAAQRIVLRETGQKHGLSAFKYLGIQEFMTPIMHGISAVFRVDTDDDNVAIDKTSSDFMWIEPELITTSLLRQEYRNIIRLALKEDY